MKREAIYESWAPSSSVWSLWARPVLFAQMRDSIMEQNSEGAWLTLNVSWAPSVGEKVVLVVDLPGKESVQTGLALVRRGFRPVPLFNACTGPHEVIDQSPIIDLLRAGAVYLANSTLADAPPAFLFDARRMTPTEVKPKDFDNRWKVFPQDFPSAAFLIERGFSRAMLIQRHHKLPAEDLAHVLCRWQDGGITIRVKDVADAALPEPIVVARPALYRSAWQRVIAMLGLRRSPHGGFGEVVPEPSHG